MIKRKKWNQEQKERLVLEMISGQTSMTEISKRESISVTTLAKWKHQFVNGGLEAKNKTELELRQKISYLESALSDLMVENQILKKKEKFLQVYKQKEKLSRITLDQSSGSKGAAKL